MGFYREQVKDLCQSFNTVAPDCQQDWLQENIECLVDAAVKDALEKAIKVMEDKSKSWDLPMKDAVETLVACIRARNPSNLS